MRKWLWKRALPVVLVLALALPYPGTFASATESGSSSSSTASGKGAFGLPEATDLVEGSQEYLEAEQNAPYGSTDNVVPLYVKSELYMTYGWSGTNRYSHIFDYNWDNEDGTKATILDEDIFEALENKYRTKFSTGGTGGILAVDTAAVNAGDGKQEYVAVLGIGKNASYLELRDKDDTLASNTLQLGPKAYLTDYAYELGGFAAVTAGDFDGDGVDSIVYYNPPTSGYKDGHVSESIVAKNGSAVTLTAGSSVIPNIYDVFGSAGQFTVAKDIPVVHLEAADVDKDGYDELIVTLGRNDVATGDICCGTQVFIYDKLGDEWVKTANYAPTAATNGFKMGGYEAAIGAKRYVWSTSSVGNVIPSDDSDTGTDFPEIVTAGWVDMYGSGKDIELDEKTLGVTIVHCTGMTEGYSGQKNYQGVYELIHSQTIEANGWTQAGCYDEDDRNSLLQVKCFNYQGGAEAEAIFLSGSVYAWSDNNGDGTLSHQYTYDYYENGDSYIGSTKITNKQIQSVAVGNFDGNKNGREQVVFANLVKESGGTKHYVSFYVYGYVETGDESTPNEWQGAEVDGWSINKKNGAYVSLTDFDYDNDGILVRYKGVERRWGDYEIMAILQPQPYFAELGDDLGEGRTAYGKSSTTGSGSQHSHGLNTTVVTGFEQESPVLQVGGGFEITIENNFTWATDVQNAVEHSIDYENNTGENAVVVYRVPVLVYHYENISDGNDMVVGKTLPPQGTVISVEQYNEEAAAYDMDEIDESKLVTAGDPFSYPSYTSQITGMGGTDILVSKNGWQELTDSNIEQTITLTTETEKSFEYEFSFDVTVWGTTGGFKVGGGAGYTYTHGSSKLNGSGTEYSGSVNGPTADGYSFTWNFAMWNMTVGDTKVPVLGYLVKDVAAPASPPTDVEVLYDTLTSTSATLKWSAGNRPAGEYRIYRVMGDGSYAYLTSVSGDKTECAISGLGESMTYTFVVRAYNDGAESVDSESVTFTTPKKGSTSYVTISKINPNYTINTFEVKAGESMTFSAVVTKNDPNALLTMQWQARDPSSGEWEDIPGANSNTLKVTNAKPSQDGTKYRLRIAVLTLQENDPIYYYSNAALLKVGALSTEVHRLRMTKTESFLGEDEYSDLTGTQETPYSGYADWSLAGETKSEIISEVSVPFKKGESNAGSVYSLPLEGSGALYIGLVSVTDSEGKATGETKYYTLEGNEASGFTQGSELAVYYKAADESYIAAATYSVDQLTCEDASGEAYSAVAYYSDSGTPERYWEKDGKYYTGEANGTMTEATPTAAPNYAVCYQSGSTYVLSALSGENGEGGSLVLLTDSTAKTFAADEYLKIGSAYYLAASFTAMTKQETREVTTSTSTPQSGTALTLYAVASSNGSPLVDQSGFFLITNTADGTSYRIEATTGSDTNAGVLVGTWTAPTAGLYAIRAGVNASESYKASASDPIYYAALGRNTASNVQDMTYLAAKLDDANGDYAASSVAYGTTLYFRENTVSADGSRASSEATGTVTLPDGETTAPLVGGCYTPTYAGQYTVESENGSKLTFAVTPIPLTVTPTLDMVAPESIADFALELTGALTSDEDTIKSLLSVNDKDGYFTKNSGAFAFVPVWSEEDDDASEVQRLRNAYSVTLESLTLRRELGKIPVAYQTEANAHGTLYGFYGDSMTTFLSGTEMSEGTKLIFQANPEAGYTVAHWLINDVYVANPDADDPYRTESLPESNQRMLVFDSLPIDIYDSLTVEAVFSSQGVSVGFNSNPENGTLRAHTAAGTEIKSEYGSTSLSYGSSVTFTATPDDGYMIDHWTVNYETYNWPDTDAPYRETTLTISELTEYCHVSVSFTAKKTVTVTAPTMVKDEGNEEKPVVTVGSITVTDAVSGAAVTAGSSVTQSAVLTYTAAFTDASFHSINYWEYSTDGGTTWTNAGSGKSITLYTSALTFGDDASLQVRAIIDSTESRGLYVWVDISALIEAGVVAENTTSDKIATVTAKSGDVALNVPGYYPVGTPVTLTLKMDSHYQATWSGWNVKPSEDGLTATVVIPATDEMGVKVTITKKPVTAPDEILVEPTLPDDIGDDAVEITVTNGGFITDGVTENEITVTSSTVTVVVLVATTDESGNVTYKRVEANAVAGAENTYSFNTVLSLGQQVITAIKGDIPINGQTDGVIDGYDIYKLKQTAAKNSWTESDLAWMDIYGDDGEIDGFDIFMLKRAANGKKLNW